MRISKFSAPLEPFQSLQPARSRWRESSSVPGHLHHHSLGFCAEDRSCPPLRRELRASDFPRRELFISQTRSHTSLKQTLCTTSSPTTIPTRLDAAHGKKTRFQSLTGSSREKGFRRYHPPICLMAPPPHLLYPLIQERILTPVPKVDAHHEGREEEQEDEQKGY